MSDAVELVERDPAQLASLLGELQRPRAKLGRRRVLVDECEQDVAVFDIGGRVFGEEGDLR